MVWVITECEKMIATFATNHSITKDQALDLTDVAYDFYEDVDVRLATEKEIAIWKNI